MHAVKFLAAFIGLTITQSVIAVDVRSQKSDLVPGISSDPERHAYYGDLHLHTTYSFDAYLGTNITPEEAYRFARGEPVRYLNETMRRSTLPLDFLAVTDHSENIGAFNTLDDPNSLLSQSGFGRQVHQEGMKLVGKTFMQLWVGGVNRYLSSVADVSKETVKAIVHEAWQHEIEAANRNYKPGTFTTFIGYEWSSNVGMRNLHRNVIFRGDQAPDPFSSADSPRPEDLWGFLEKIRKQGYEALAIPHNSNGSDGLMFDWVDSGGKPIDEAYAQRRATNEPLVELVQQKGQSETHPMLSPTDEFANFETMDFMHGFHPEASSKLAGSYVRDALGRGMEIAKHAGGVNPFKYGFVGGSDIHSGLSESSEASLAQTHEKDSARQPTESQKEFAKGYGAEFKTAFPNANTNWAENVYDQIGTPGLTGVWAEQNTRESIYAALRRKETFATSGTRLKFRFFGGWSYGSDLLKNKGWVKTAYSKGVPMGGDLPAQPPGKSAPTFAVWAVKDPNGANLDRLQIVKVWLDNGKHIEAVYDVALSNGRAVDPKTGKAPAVGNTVDLKTATYKNTIGATELAAVWSDSHFDPNTQAVYYLRVLEIPTPRHSTILAVKRGQPLPAGISATIQERGWSSPIWHEAPGKPARNGR